LKKHNLVLMMVASIWVFAFSCASPEKTTRKKQDKADTTAQSIKTTEQALEDKGRAYNYGTSIFLDWVTNQEPAIKGAKDFNNKSQVLLGPPSPEDAVTMNEIVEGRLSQDAGRQKKADKQEDKFLGVIADLHREKAELTEQHAKELSVLKEQNAANADDAEKWRDHQRKTWYKRIFASLGIFGTIVAVIAIMVFVPPAIPLIARFLGWFVSKLPAAAGAVGAVSLKTFDATVKGVGGIRNHFKLKPDHQYTGAEVKAIIDAQLKEVMDEDHKRLVESRREKLGVDYVRVN
jgi:hypothetical protein